MKNYAVLDDNNIVVDILGGELDTIPSNFIEFTNAPEDENKVITGLKYENGSFVDPRGFAEKREGEYPPVGDQLDALYHAGIFPADMESKIKTVKNKHPKE